MDKSLHILAEVIKEEIFIPVQLLDFCVMNLLTFSINKEVLIFAGVVLPYHGIQYKYLEMMELVVTL